MAVGKNGAVVPRVLLMVIGSLFPLAFGTVPSAAHTDAVSIEPADSSRLATPPAQIAIRAADELTSAQIVLTTPAARVERLSVSVDGRNVSAPLPPDGPRGDYTLAYRLVASDGHAITGSSTFTVTAGAEPDFAAATTEDSSAGVPVIGLVVGALVVLAVGAALMLVKVRR